MKYYNGSRVTRMLERKSSLSKTSLSHWLWTENFLARTSNDECVTTIKGELERGKRREQQLSLSWLSWMITGTTIRASNAARSLSS